MNKRFQLQPKSISEIQTKYISKHCLPAYLLELERGRFFDIDRSERICKHCLMGNVEYEFHFILICPFYERIKEKHIKKYYYKKPSALKLIQLLAGTLYRKCPRFMSIGEIFLFLVYIC